MCRPRRRASSPTARIAGLSHEISLSHSAERIPAAPGRGSTRGSRASVGRGRVHIPDVLEDPEYALRRPCSCGDVHALDSRRAAAARRPRGRRPGAGATGAGDVSPSDKSNSSRPSPTRPSSRSRTCACSTRCRRAPRSSPPRSTTCARRRTASSSRRSSPRSASSPPASPTRSRTRSTSSTIFRPCRASWSASLPT